MLFNWQVPVNLEYARIGFDYFLYLECQTTQPAFTCSKSTTEKLEGDVKYVQS